MTDLELVRRRPVLIGGICAGTWRRTPERDRVDLEVSTFAALGDEELAAVEAEAERSGRFLELPVNLRPAIR